MSRLAHWCFEHRRRVVAGWLLALVAMFAVSTAVGSKFDLDSTLPGTDSQLAYNLLDANFPAAAGEGDEMVIHTIGGATVSSAQTRGAVTHALTEMAGVPGVTAIDSPYAAGGAGQISADGATAFATVTWNSATPAVADVTALIAAANSASTPTIEVSLSGSAIGNTEDDGAGLSVSVGVIAALVVLLLVFGGAVFPSLLPLLATGLALVISLSVTAVLTHLLKIPSIATDLAVLIGLGVGVDYGLFIISRHRTAVKAGASYHDAAVKAVSTSGRTVLFAGITVCIALLGQLTLGVGFLGGMSIATAIAVASTMATSLTFLPAMFGFLGPKVLSRRERRTQLTGGPVPQEGTGFWLRWAALVERRKVLVAVGSLVAVLVIALPVLTLRLGSSDSGTDAHGSTTRQAYDTLAQGFGPGVNGPLALVADIRSPADTQAFDSLLASIAHTAGVTAVTPPTPSPNGRVTLATVYPSTGPQDRKTVDLVEHLRQDLIPAAQRGTGLTVHVGGQTASNIDFSRTLSGKLPLFVAVVVLLAFLLLMIVFRSLLIPLVASVMNLLSIGAALGAMNAVFNWGFGQSLLGLSGAGPIDSFLPVLMFSVLFGLSMDYEVYLVSRMREEWRAGQPTTGPDMRDLAHRPHQLNGLAVRTGHAKSGRVIAAAAVIMVLVFGSFLLGGERQLQEFGFGLAFSVLVDAPLVRSLLVPALMHLIGPANWNLPKRLDKILPQMAIEADEMISATPPELESARRH
ncbi:RND superfamily putative drug exporter [Nakamurella sp. UYEF19]|uniref:MMPL family transporter n=1 Tax=Nakamurella sp. UYEF19 TaxID=1756392 RepID=UPI0033995E3C